MTEGYKLSKEVVDFLYNGCIAFYPDQFYSEDQKVAPAVFYSGQNKETFEQKLLKVTQAQSLQDAIKIVRGWKIAVDRGEEIFSTIPTNIKELVESYEKSQEEQETPKSVEKARESIAKAKERAKAAEKGKPQEEKGELKIKDVKVEVPEINLYSPIPRPAITLTKEQQQIVKLAHQDPQEFANQLKERIIETSKLNPENPLEIDSADMVAKTLTLKLLGIDSKKPQVFIDSSPFETLAFFARPENEELARIIPNPEAREEIARISLEALHSLAEDSTIAANFVNQAFGQDWSPFFIPSQIRELKVSQEEKPPKGGTNVNLNEFLNQLASLQTIERQIKNTVIDKETYNNLTRQQKAKLEKEIKEAAKKISSTSRAFSFITGKKIPSPSQNIALQTPEWINVQFASIGLLTPEQSSFVAASLNFGNFSSPNILSSPIFNFAFEKFIKKIPAVGKLNTVVSGMTTKLSTKVAAKIATTKLGAALAANIIPAIGQAISAITLALSLKDIATAIKVWLKKNEDKLPFILAGILVGAFALTGAPLYLIAGVGIIGASRAASIGAFLGGLFSALTNIVLASLVIPMLIVFIGIPILVAIILFIINSGAYVYPPSTKMASLGPGAVVNEYIEVTKLAYSEKYPEKGKSSELSFENNQLPLEITYEITIKAKKGSLTNISISETCNVTKKNNIPSCPNPNPAIPNGSNIGTIDSASPYTFTYKKTFTSPQFEDTLTIDTITVSATNAEGESVSSAGSASIKIGNPPEECPSGWPIMPEGGETSLRITQGPRGIFSHLLVEAIDIAATTGHSIISTHSGTATVVRTSNAYRPLYIDVESTCNGKTIITRYAHLSASSVSTGQKVIKGQIIGLSGSDGTGPHLHYEFRQNIKMDVPYIPKHVPYGCSNNCGNIP